MMANDNDRKGNGYEIVSNGDLPPRAHIYDYLIVLARHRWKIVTFVVIGTVLVFAYMMVQPQTYSASATLMPPEQQKGVSFTDLIGKSTGLDFQSLGKNASAEIFVKMLTSRTLIDSLIDRFDLIKRYGLKPGQRELARRRVQGELAASSDREGMISITFDAQTGFMPSEREQRQAAVFAAEVVNAAVDLLDRLNREKMVTSARRSREFIGRMRAIKRKERDRAQEALLQFQQRNKAIALDQQVEASVAALTEIELQIQKVELELRAAQTGLTAEAGVVRALEAQLRQLRQQKQRVQNGGTAGDPYALDMRTIPGLAKDYATLKLDLEVAVQVYTYLEAQYHQEEVQEARDLPTVSALDPAVPPEYRSSPRRGLTLMVAVPILAVIGIVGAFILEAIRRQTHGVDEERAAALRDALKRRRKVRIANVDEHRN